MRRLLLFSAFSILCVAPLWSQGASQYRRPIPEAQLIQKLNPSFHHPDPLRYSPEQRAQIAGALQAGSLQTLPYWQGSFSISGKDYNYTILGGSPQNGGTTTIKTLIVPLRITISDYSIDGSNPLVFDATQALPQILGSPIFQVSDYITGIQQFGDAMLHAEFPLAAAGWKTLLSAKVAPALDITIAAGGAQVYQAKSGALFANILDDSAIDKTILTMLQQGIYPPDEYPIFVSYNSSEHDALGYHAAGVRAGMTEENVFAYTSWLVGLDNLFSFPSPDAATLSHEVAETIHDAFIGNLTSLTLLWGDPFDHNKCFQPYIEVGDAVEDAPPSISLHEQVVGFGHQAHVFTLQNEALLPWFERQTPSQALAGAYSFPDIWVLSSAAPLTCVP
jgi:hypothetical protein